ncbi:MAG: type II toxin-antitoxin system PemK/MazF family toxin [Oscillospiraceae bacterium]
MKIVKRGDIYFCRWNLAATGSEEQKDRPVVIAQNDTGNAHAPTAIVVPMTHAPRKRQYPTQFDVAMPTGKISRVLCEQTTTVDKSRLLRKMGQLTKLEMQQLDRRLCDPLVLQ